MILVLLMFVIGVLNRTGLWPEIMRGLRELRGERVDDGPSGNGPSSDLCYKILGVSPSAAWQDIERAYRQKAKIHHPDHGGDEDTMRALNDAYATLKKLRRSR